MLPEALPLAMKEVRGAVGQRPPIIKQAPSTFSWRTAINAGKPTWEPLSGIIKNFGRDD